MDNLADFVVSFVDFNEGLDFDLIIKLVVSYLVVFWVIVSLWVLKDAKDRFNNIFVALILAILNLILFLPFLVLYLLARPHIEDEFEDWSEGGVNVPIVNFVGKEGVEMSFELRINPKKLGQPKHNEGEMKIDINFHSDDEDKKHVVPSMVTSANTEAKSSSQLNSEVKSVSSKPNLLKKFFSNIKAKLSAAKAKMNNKVENIKAKNAEKDVKKEEKKVEETTSENNNQSESDNSDSNDSQDRKKKKKKKKKKK